MLKTKLFLVALVLVPYCSYSESISPYYGQTGNVANNGNTWSMDSYLPSNVPGLDINGVIYNYTINKNTNDQVGVEVRNKRATGSGYIFRSRDDWLPGSLGGTQINKVVPVAPSNRALWGDGEIAVDGPGSVTDPRLIYTYKVDPCFNPQFDPNCPGYVRPDPYIYEVDLDSIYDPLKDEFINIDLSIDTDLLEEDEKEELSEEELAEKELEEKKDRAERLEKALAAADTSAFFAQSIAQASIVDSMNRTISMDSYYQQNIVGGVYKDNVVLIDSKLPESRSGLRNGLAQQILHEKMIDMQY